MNKDFKVGQIYTDRVDCQWKVVEIDINSDLYHVGAKSPEGDEMWFTSEGLLWDGEKNSKDLITLIQDVPIAETPIIVEEFEEIPEIIPEVTYTKEQFLDAIQLHIKYNAAQMQPFYNPAFDAILKAVADPRYEAYKSFKKEFNLG